jgi:hypothetical protein
VERGWGGVMSALLGVGWGGRKGAFYTGGGGNTHSHISPHFCNAPNIDNYTFLDVGELLIIEAALF